MRKKCGYAVRVLAFILIGVFIFQRLSWVVEVYGTDQDSPDRRSALFYSLPRNTVDCLFIGNSHVYCSYIPKQLFDEQGFTSAIISSSSQSVQNSYYLLKEALLHQSPKVVVFDVSNVIFPENYDDIRDFRLHYTSGISILPDTSIYKYENYSKIKELTTGYAPSITYEDAYAFLEYKSNFDRGALNLTSMINTFVNPASEYRTFGYYATPSVYPMEQLVPHTSSDAYKDINDVIDFQYFEKMVELCKENDIDLVAVRALYTTDVDDSQMYNQLFQYLDEESIPFIDYFALVDELGINLQTDFRDVDHVNILGAQKITRYMGQYLMSCYNLPNSQESRKGKLWRTNSFDYQARIEEAKTNANITE